MLGEKGFEGIYTLIKGLESLPFEKQEEFLKSQKITLENEVVVIRKGNSFCLDVVKAKGGVFTPEVAKKDDEDTIPDEDEGHVENDAKSTKSEEVDLEKDYSEDNKDEKSEVEKEEDEYKDDDTKKAMDSVVEFNRMFEEMNSTQE